MFSFSRPAVGIVLALLTLSPAFGLSARSTALASSQSTPNTDLGESAISSAATSGDCESMSAGFRAVESANPDLADPELVATCEDGVVVVNSNAVPDFLYIATSPGEPTAQELTFRIPSVPTEAEEAREVALLGPIAVAIDGLPIYGPTEGNGGDVLSLQGGLSECGGHTGPTGYHFHLIGWSDGVDCLYSSDEVEAGEPLLVGWSVDGYPIMSGLVCIDKACTATEQLESSWELTNPLLFATDTWAAHSYVEGSGDLDECNGRVDTDGQYRYYTTESFPYVLGCYHGEVADDAIDGARNGAPRR